MKPRAGKVACPTCKKIGDWFSGKYGPFCSHRCKLIDLGKWLGGEHVISESLRPDRWKKHNAPPCVRHLDAPTAD